MPPAKKCGPAGAVRRAPDAEGHHACPVLEVVAMTLTTIPRRRLRCTSCRGRSTMPEPARWACSTTRPIATTASRPGSFGACTRGSWPTSRRRAGRCGSLARSGHRSRPVPLVIADALPRLRIDGIDLSADMIELAWQNVTVARLEDRVTFVVGDFAKLPYRRDVRPGRVDHEPAPLAGRPRRPARAAPRSWFGRAGLDL